MTEQEKEEVRHLLEVHERTVDICRICANTLRDLAWETKRGSVPSADELTKTIDEVDRVLDDLGKMEMALARLKAGLW
jgi:hypothetical protein